MAAYMPCDTPKPPWRSGDHRAGRLKLKLSTTWAAEAVFGGLVEDFVQLVTKGIDAHHGSKIPQLVTTAVAVEYLYRSPHLVGAEGHV